MSAMPRYLKIGLVAVTIIGVISVGYFVGIVGRIRAMVHDTETEANPFTPPATPLYAANDLPMGAPSRTRSAASSTALFMGMLVTTSAEIRSASSTGTALAVKMLKVREKRPVLRPRINLPSTGKRNKKRSKRSRASGDLSQRIKPQTMAAMASNP